MLVACSRSAPDTPTVKADPERPKAVRTSTQSTISSLMESEGQVLAEIPAGSRQGVDGSTFFRVYDPEQPQVIKAMLKVREVLGPEQSVAVLIGGLFDLNNPLAAGDTVRMVDDLGLYGSGKQVEQAVQNEVDRLQTETDAERKAFDSLRQQFQERLRQLMAEHDRKLVEQQAAHEQAVQDLKEAHARRLEAKELERRSDLAALRTTLMQDARGQVSLKGREMQDSIRELSKERDALQSQVDQLLREQKGLREHISGMVQEQAEKRKVFEEELRAETETRAILEARLAKIENNLQAEETPPEAILSNSSQRNETILERLERISTERDQARTREALLSGQVDALQQENEQLSHRLEVTRNQVQDLTEQRSDEDSLRRELQQTQTRLTATREHLDAASLARLEAERQLYQLVLQVLQVEEGQPRQLEYLKANLRDGIAGKQPLAEEPQS
ncbi:MAG: hypothetical protein ACOCXA_06745 [Planctomycetota bacterium]